MPPAPRQYGLQPTDAVGELMRRGERRTAPSYAWPGPRAHRFLRQAWDAFESKLTATKGRRLLALFSSIALRLQYRERCAVRWFEGAWEYQWPGATIVTPGVLLSRARPEEWGTLPGASIYDMFLWEYAPRPGDVVFDVGAGFGTELFALSRLVSPTGKVYAFEAHPETYAILNRLRSLNDWPEVELVGRAVTEHSGWTTISDGTDPLERSVVDESGISVPAITIDEFVKMNGIEHIDFLKMNIEGAERLAIRGMTHAATIIDHLCICCHDFLDDAQKKTKREVREWLIAQGFEVTDQPNSPWLSVRDYVYGCRRTTEPTP